MTPIALPDDVDDSEVPDFENSQAQIEPRARDASPVLTAPQRIAVWELATGSKRAEAARLAGVNEKTLWGWTRKPWFMSAVDEASAMIVDITRAAPLAAKSRVCANSPDVADELVRKALDRDDPDQFRAISKALEVAGLTGTRGGSQQTNVQVNIDNRQVLEADMEAARILAQQSSRDQG